MKFLLQPCRMPCWRENLKHPHSLLRLTPNSNSRALQPYDCLTLQTQRERAMLWPPALKRKSFHTVGNCALYQFISSSSNSYLVICYLPKAHFWDTQMRNDASVSQFAWLVRLTNGHVCHSMLSLAERIRLNRPQVDSLVVRGSLRLRALHVQQRRKTNVDRSGTPKPS